MIYDNQVIPFAEAAAQMFPSSTIRMKDVPKEFVPKDYEKAEVNEWMRVKHFDNGSEVIIDTLPF